MRIFPAILSLLAILPLGTRTASAETDKLLVVEFETLVTAEDSFRPGVAVLTAVQASDGALGGFISSWVGETYAESYGGFSLAFPLGDGHLWTAYGIGIEQSVAPDDHSPLRLGAITVFESPEHLLSVQLEIGATQRNFVEPYYNFRYAWKTKDWFDFGIMARKFAGIGPRMDFWLHQPGFGIWVAPLYDPDSRALAGMITLATGY